MICFTDICIYSRKGNSNTNISIWYQCGQNDWYGNRYDERIRICWCEKFLFMDLSKKFNDVYMK